MAEYPIETIGDVAPVPEQQGTSPGVPIMTKLALAGLVAGALVYMSPQYRAWEKRLSGAQRIGLAIGIAGLFLGVVQVAMAREQQRRMVSFERDPRPPEPT
jgi:hypothetical protein